MQVVKQNITAHDHNKNSMKFNDGRREKPTKLKHEHTQIDGADSPNRLIGG
jgi:hypothetical protein